MNIQDLLDKEASLIIYMVKQGEQWFEWTGDHIQNGKCTRLIQDSYDKHARHKLHIIPY